MNAITETPVDDIDATLAVLIENVAACQAGKVRSTLADAEDAERRHAREAVRQQALQAPPLAPGCDDTNAAADTNGRHPGALFVTETERMWGDYAALLRRSDSRNGEAAQ